MVNSAQTHILLYKNIKRTDKPTNGQTGTDMEKGVDARTMSAETFENCGNFGTLKIIYSYCGKKPYIFGKILNIWQNYRL